MSGESVHTHTHSADTYTIARVRASAPLLRLQSFHTRSRLVVVARRRRIPSCCCAACAACEQQTTRSVQRVCVCVRSAFVVRRLAFGAVLLGKRLRLVALRYFPRVRAPVRQRLQKK